MEGWGSQARVHTMRIKMGCQPRLALAMTGGCLSNSFFIRGPRCEEIFSCAMRFGPPECCVMVVANGRCGRSCGGWSVMRGKGVVSC